MKLKFDLAGQLVVVTGGAGLLGNAFSLAICEAGGRVVVAENSQDRAIEGVEKILEKSPDAQAYPVEMDITDEESVRAALAVLAEKYGQVDALVNNAYPRNKNYGKKFFEVEYDDFCQNVGMNIGGYFVTSKVFADYFIKSGCGNIINVASIYGVVAPRFEVYEGTGMTMPVEYSVIKSGLIHLTKYMAKSFSGNNIRVNALSPGGISDGQNSTFVEKYNSFCTSKGMLDKEDLTGALVFLLSESSKYINGQNIVVDDGFVL
jgi:NAD(P)-dependent dehydrogenase (short-subunit alcohol dehydrogenase family)